MMDGDRWMDNEHPIHYPFMDGMMDGRWMDELTGGSM